MKITAKVEFLKPANRGCLIREFFSEHEFSPMNYIHIVDDKTAEVVLYFDDTPPQGIIRAIGYCNVVELEFSCNYPGTLALEQEEEACSSTKPNNYEENEGIPKKISHNNCNMEMNYLYGFTVENLKALLEDNSDDQQDVVNELKRYVGRFGRKTPSENDYMDIAKLDLLANHSTNFQCFVELVCRWLNLSKESTSYVHRITTELAKKDKKAYEYSLKEVKETNETIGFRESQRVKVDREIVEKLLPKGYKASMHLFLITVMKYYSRYKNEEAKEPEIPDTIAEQPEETEVSYKIAEQPEEAEAPDKTAEQLEDAEAPDKTAEQPEEAEAPDTIAEQPEETEVSDKIAEQPEEAEAPDKTAEQPEEAEAPDKTVEQPKEQKETDIIERQPEETTEAKETSKEVTELNLLKSKLFCKYLAECEGMEDVGQKIEHLYTKMGLFDISPSLFNSFYKITMTATKMDELSSIDEVFDRSNVGSNSKEADRIRTKVSDFINEFCKKSKIKRMKVIAFLREIKQIFTT